MPRPSRLLALAAALLAAAAAAQSPPQAALPYRSPLAAYQPFTEENVVSWKEANDTVGRIGGWREYARESVRPASSPAAAPAAPVAPATPAAPADHGGHQH